MIPSDISDGVTIYNHFNYDNRKQLKVKFYLFQVSWGYDILDSKKSDWYGVILRYIQDNLNSENIKKVCEHYGTNIYYALRPTMVRDTLCTIVRTYNLEDAENICIRLPQNLKCIKAHLHPKCCKIRLNPEKSIFKQFYKNSNEIPTKSGKVSQSQNRVSNTNESLISMIINNSESQINNSFIMKKRFKNKENS